MWRVWTVAWRELKGLFDQLTGYILLVVFLVVANFLFFRQAYLLQAATLRPLLDFLPWIFLIFVPAITMRTLAEDLRSGTLEVVLAQPVTELELLLGKYVGAVLAIWGALALTLAVPVGLSLGADLAVGIIVAQYVGAALLGAGLAGVGLWASSLTRNQITAFIVAVAVMFVLILVGLDPLLVGLPPTLGTIAARLGVLSHFSNIGRGVIDLRDAIYFVTLAGVFLLLAYGALVSRKLSPRGETVRRLRLGVAVLVAAMVVVNLLGGYIGGRLDLTPGNAYTLSRATKALVRGVDDLVTVKVFASDELPPEVSLVKRDLDDLLRDYRAAGRGKVRVIERDPADDEEIASEARSLGIPPIQFNVIGQSELQVKEGYLGLAVQYADRVEAIPFVQRTDDLEYRLSSIIRSLDRQDTAAVGLVTAGTDFRGGTPFGALRDALSQTYEVRSLSLGDSTQPAQSLKAVVLAGDADSLPDDQLQRLRAYLDGGGSVLVLASGMRLDPQSPFAMSSPVSWNQLLAPYGVSVRSDMVYDLASNERVSLPTQFGRVFLPYPFWVRALSTRAVAVNQDVQSVLLPWASSVDTAGATAGTVMPLLVSSEGAGVSAGQALIDPNREYPRDSLATRLLAVLVNPQAAENGADRPAGRVIVVGSADFISDRFAQSAPENLDFALNAVDWLAQDEALIAIRSKDRTPPPLVFESQFLRDAVKHGNLIGVPLLVALAAAVHLWRRRQLSRRPYRPLAEAA